MSAEHRNELGVALALLVVVFAVYAPTLGFRYAQDSYPAVKANPVVERGDLREILTSDYWKDTGSLARTLYRPVTVASFAFERRVGGEADPRLSHLINIVLHAIAAWCLYRFARNYGAATLVAVAASFLFALHPLDLHTVANVVGRADILAVLFSLGALICFSHTRVVPGGGPSRVGRRRLAAWGTGLFVWLALGSKEIGAAVLPLLLLCDLLVPGATSDSKTRWRERVVLFAPTVVAVIVYLHLRTLAIGEFPGWQPLAAEDNVLVGMTGLPRVATTLAMAGRYTLLLFWPVRLSPDYSAGMIATESTLLAPLPLLGLTAIVLLLFPIVRAFAGRRGDGSRRLPALAAALCLVPYLFVGNVITLNAAGFAERLIYFSTAGLGLIVAIGLFAVASYAPQRRRAAARLATTACVALLVLASSVQIRRLLPMWRNNKSLFEYTARVAPGSLRAALQTAGRLVAEDRLPEAVEVYERIEVFAPEYGGAWMAHGVLLNRLGELAGAERLLRRSIELDPHIGENHFQLAQVLIARGRYGEAERRLRKTLLLNAGRLEAAVQLGHLLFNQGRYAEAVYFYEGAVAFGRDDLRARLREARARSGLR